MVTDELLARWVNLESETVQDKRWQQSNKVTKSSVQEECDTYNSLFLLKHYLALGVGSCTWLLHQ